MACCTICCNDGCGSLVACSFCLFEACEGCQQTFLTMHLKEPSCMSCSKVWSREFVMEKMDRKWVRTSFLPHMGVLIMEQEKMLLPSTQGDAATTLKIRSLQAEVSCMPTNAKLERLFKKEPEALALALEEKRERRSVLRLQIDELKDSQEPANKRSTKEVAAPLPVYVMKCPCGTCRGYVSEDYVCGTCNMQVCKKCHVATPRHTQAETEANKSKPKANPAHKCNADDVASAKLIQRDTKQCPKCMTPIFKISGCAQMFCTQCQTAFDWETGKIEMGIMHNPHFFDWLAANKDNNQQQVVEEVACGELVNVNVYVARVQHAYPQKVRNLMMIYRSLIHLQAEVAPEFVLDRVKDNHDLRVGFLVKDISDREWATKLMNREKRRMKIKAFKDLVDLEITILTDFVRQVMYTREFEAVLEQFGKMCMFHHTAIERIALVYGGSIPPKMKADSIFVRHF